MEPRRALRTMVLVWFGVAGCGSSGGTAPRDAARDEDVATRHDARVEPDAAGEPDASAGDSGPGGDGSASLDAARPDGDAEDATPEDAGSPEIDPVAACDVPSMIDQYPGFLPPNPYGAWEAASSCVAAEHDVIVVLGCPSNADGTPSSCQSARADLAVALSSAGYGRRFITTGAAVHNAYVEAEALRALLLERGIADSDIVVEPLAEHTDENLYHSSRVMRDRGWQSAVVVSDDAGHLVFTGLCDANCCVQLGRMTVLDFPVAGRMPIRAGHYVLDPYGPPVEAAECTHISSPTKALCLNRAMRRACADDLRL